MTRRPTARRGFTLLELVIAMAIAATIALVLYSTLSTAFKARTSVLNQTAMMREAAIALDLVEADIENATPPTAEPTAPAGRVFGPMYGEADTLSLFTLGRDFQQTTTATGNNSNAQRNDVFANGVRQVSFSLAAEQGNAGKNALVRSVQRNVLSTAGEAAEDESLVGGLAALTFRYYDGSQWADRWYTDEESNYLPLAIEVSIDLKGSDGRGGERTYHMVRVVPIACADATLLAARGSN